MHCRIIYRGDNMDVLATFAYNLKKYRKLKGFSQKDFAKIAGLHRTYISAIECGKRSIALENVQKIANALDIETYQLFLTDIDEKKSKGV
mgnify:CR=1 FL=1|jgi:transcriptional regulator with XRE-family HTH domain